MKVLIISSNIEQSNSVGKIATEMCQFINESGNESHILYFMGKSETIDHTTRIRNRYLSSFVYRITQFSEYRFVKSPLAIHSISNFIKNYKPDVIHLIQPLIRFIDNEGLLKLIGETGIPCVYTMIDENAYLGNCDNAYDCEQFIQGCERCEGVNKENNNTSKCWKWSKEGCRRVAVNKKKAYECIKNISFVAPQWVIERAESSALLKGKKFYIVDEYVNNIKVYYPRTTDELCKKYDIDINKVIITNVAKYSNPRKGVKYFVQLAKKFENNDKYLFVNIGYDGPQDSLPSNYKAIPFVANQNELAEFYSLADLAMITSLSDTMPNTSLEALSCGSPVCGFNITGVPYVADEPLGIFVEPRNVEALFEVVKNTEKKTLDISRKCREYALRRYSPEVSGKRMLNIYRDMIERGNL